MLTDVKEMGPLAPTGMTGAAGRGEDNSDQSDDLDSEFGTFGPTGPKADELVELIDEYRHQNELLSTRARQLRKEAQQKLDARKTAAAHYGGVREEHLLAQAKISQQHAVHGRFVRYNDRTESGDIDASQWDRSNVNAAQNQELQKKEAAKAAGIDDEKKLRDPTDGPSP